MTAAITIKNLAHHVPAKVARRYHVSIAADWNEVAAQWQADHRFAVASPFQHAAWYSALYGAMASQGETLQPLIVCAFDAESGELAMRLPFVLLKERGLRTIAFADLDLTDYNAPQLGSAAPASPAEANRLWKAIVQALPPADVIRLRKMPLEKGGKPNPMAWLQGIRACPVNGNILVAENDWEAHRFARERTFRKELERSWRVFTREPSARFEVVTDPAGIARVFASMEEQQAVRMRSVGAQYVLDAPVESKFYRDLVTTGIASGYVVLTALVSEGQVVGSLLGIRDRDTYVMIRISNAAGKWANVSPGRLIIEKTMEHLHAQGYRRFDFSIGNYSYKRRFGVSTLPLVDYTQTIGLRGLPVSFRDHAAAKLRQYPRVRELLCRAIGKPVPREEA